MTHKKIKLFGLIVATIILFVTIAVSKNRSRINIGVYGTKILTTRSGYISCEISFYKHGHYTVELYNQATDDIVEDLYLSCGDYSVNNKEVTLTDKTYGIQMSLYMDNDTLTAGQSFACMENRRFTYFFGNYGWYTPYSRISASRLEKKRKEFNNTHPRPAPLDFGKYNDTNFPVSLYIQSDSSFNLVYSKIVLSDGKWDRDGNILMFFDKHLNDTFYALINEDGSLTSCFLPGYESIFVKK